MAQEPLQVVCGSCLSRVPQNAAKCPYCGHSFANTNPAGTLPINTLLDGRYTVCQVLNLDGEGVTYSAIDNQLTRRVYVREYLPAAISSARTMQGAIIPRPEREVLYKTTRMDFADMYRSLIALSGQPGLNEVYDLFEANNTAYAVHEPDTGHKLSDYLNIRQQPITPQAAVEMLSPVIKGVEAMHKRGLLHRGISPETIYVSSDGKAKLSGYATLGLRTADGDIKSQMFDGYSAPEQYSAAEFDGQYTDVYALAAVLYRMLTGKAPASAWLRSKTDTLEPVRSLNSSVPNYIAAAVMRAMRLEPDERIQSVPEFFEAITEPSSQATSFHFTDRQKKYIYMAAAGLALVVLICVIAIYAVSCSKTPTPSSSSEVSSVSIVASESQTSQNTGVVNPFSDIPIASSSQASSSSAKEQFEVPKFIGQLYTDVQRNVEYQKQFGFVTKEEFSNDFAKGYIMEQSISSGTKVDADTVITLTVSKGAEAAKMPVVIGLSQDAAIKALNEAGIKYNIVSVDNDGSLVAGYVSNCDVPEAGTEVPKDKTVTLYVAKAAPPPAPPASSSSSSQASSASSESQSVPIGEGAVVVP